MLFKIWIHLGKIGLLNFLPDRIYQMIAYFLKFHRKCNLDNPSLFSEKIQWLMLYNRNKQYTQMVDKYQAKNYVAVRIGEQYVVSTLGAYEKFDDIELGDLPDNFVLKCTHDSGSTVVCNDKNKINEEWRKIRFKFTYELKRNYYKCFREWPYKDIEPKIIAEEYLENDPEEGLHDYKIWCFNGEAKFIQYITGRLNNGTYEGFYDSDWNQLNFSYHNPILTESVSKPLCLNKLLELASKLAEGQPFVRIDFYILPDNSIRFGEITFYPMVGLDQFHPEDMDEKLGDLIDLSLVEKREG